MIYFLKGSNLFVNDCAEGKKVQNWQQAGLRWHNLSWFLLKN
jgi:hypothetical protein